MTSFRDWTPKRVLVACEMSALVRDAFRELGHDAWSCDILPTEGDPKYHIQGDVIPLLTQGWDMMIGFPPCTHLSLSGARWATDHWVKRKNKPARWHDGTAKRAALKEAVEFFRTLWTAPIQRICLENPMSRASSLVAKKSQTIQPWQFGHGEKKTTWLWLKNLPPLKPTNVVEGREERVFNMPPSDTRSIDRSRTFEGVAKAMSQQWNNL